MNPFAPKVTYFSAPCGSGKTEKICSIKGVRVITAATIVAETPGPLLAPTFLSENNPDSTTAGIDSRNEKRAASPRV